MLWRFLKYVRPYLPGLGTAALLLLISGALMASVVSTVKPLVNEVLLPAASVEVREAKPDAGPSILDRVHSLIPADRVARWARDHAFVEVPLLIVLIYLIKGVFSYFGQYMTVRAGNCVIRDLRMDLYRSVAYQSLQFFQVHPTGWILSRILNDVARLQSVATTSLANGLRVGAMVPFLLAIALYHEWKMSLLFIVALPALSFPMIRLGKRLRRAATASQEHMADVAHRITESVSGIRVVQAFGMEVYEVDRVGGAVQRMLRADLRAARAAALSPAVIELFASVVGAGMFTIAGYQISRGQLNPGNFAVVLFCLGILFVSIRRLNVVYNDFQRALSAAERVFGMLDWERAVQDRPGAEPLPRFTRELRFEGIDFSYGDENVLSGIDLTIRSGEVIALVGASGSGKSTLASLLSRFYDPTGGRILVDGHDIRSVTLESLRDQIGVVTQEPVLFDDSVRNNIAYGRDDCPPEKIVAVARAAQAHEFIENLPQGYDTILGEGGSRLSMGQRQRLTIARALLKDPPLLILDEATSALDAESESLVQEALDVLMHGRTSIVIAHRLATVRRADRIVVVEAGRIAEQGTHDELLASGGVYARLHELQFKTGAGMTGTGS